MHDFSDFSNDVDINFFNCETKKLTDIVNCRIVIKDFIDNIKTTYGSNRYVVLFSLENDQNTEYKFITNAQHIKRCLDFARKSDMIPFTTTIKASQSNSKTMYKLT